MSVRSNNNKARKGTKKNPLMVDQVSSSISKNQITPVRIERSLYYIDENLSRNNVGAQYLVFDYRINDLWDPDPLILSGSVTGFQQQMAFYNLYRVLTVEAQVDISNNENFPVLWGIVYSNQPLVGVASTKLIALSFLENGFSSGAKILSAKGGADRGGVRAKTPVYEILGNKKEYMADVRYAGQGLASPSLPLYMSLIVVGSSSTNLANGVGVFLKLNFQTEFFGRRPLNS